MRKLLIAVAALASFETAAAACTCTEPESDVQRRDIARRIAARAIAIVEVEPVSGPDVRRQIGETYRIVQVEFGQAALGPIRMARSFGVDRSTGEPWMAGSSCDVFPGYRKRVLLMRTGYAPAKGGDVVPAYTFPGKPCGQLLPVRDAPADLISRGFVPVFSFGGTCEDAFLSDPGAIELIREEARKMGRPLGA
jgi:hypothetical protein